jgi:hypothetical protein
VSHPNWPIVAQAARVVGATGAFAEAPMVGARWDALARELLELKACLDGADALRGIEWWNALTEAERTCWLTAADTAIPAEAWTEHKRRTGADARTSADQRKTGSDALTTLYAVQALAATLQLDPAHRFDRTAIAALIEREARRVCALVAALSQRERHSPEEPFTGKRNDHGCSSR